MRAHHGAEMATAGVQMAPRIGAPAVLRFLVE